MGSQMEAMMFPGSKQTTNRLFELFLLCFMREPVLATAISPWEGWCHDFLGWQIFIAL